MNVYTSLEASAENLVTHPITHGIRVSSSPLDVLIYQHICFFIEYCSLSVSIPLLNLNNKWMLGQQESAIQKQHCDLGNKYSSCIHTCFNNPTPRIVLFVLPSVRFFFTIRVWTHVLILDHDHDHGHDHYQWPWPWNRTKTITMIMISGQFCTIV